MIYSQLKLYRPTNSLLIPPSPQGKNVCLGFFGENVNFIDVYRRLNIKPASVKNIFVPKIVGPAATRLTPEYKKILKNHKLIPVTGILGDYSSVSGRNFYLDYSSALDRLLTRYNITNYQSPISSKRILPLLNTLTGVPQSDYERVLLYAVSLDQGISPIIMKRKFYIVYKMLLQWYNNQSTQLPFDKILMFVYNAESSRYILLFDKSSDLNKIQRLKTILMNMKMSDEQLEEENELSDVSQEISSNNTVLDKKDDIIDKSKRMVKDFISDFPEITGFSNGDIRKYTLSGNMSSETDKAMNFKDTIVSASILSRTMGDPIKALRVAKKLQQVEPKIRKNIVNKAMTYALPKEDSKTASRNPIITMSNPIAMTDGVNPGHILEKRKSDFKESLKDDILDAFKVLSRKPLPMKVKNIKIETLQTPASELKTTIKDRYTLILTDYENNEHEVIIELPHLMENGAFFVNGMKKVLINQLVIYPIFFLKPYMGKFTSSYSSVTIYSKILRKSSYLMLFMCGYKLPLMMYLCYKLGFEETLKSYGVEYEILDQKVGDSVLMPNGKHILFKSNNEAGKQLSNGFFYFVNSLPKTNIDLNDHVFWKTVLETFIGNRNCTYLLDQVWSNVVTPIEIKLLESRGDPTEIKDIIRYISSEVVTGKVDDRNSLEKQRIRTSEIFISLIQKQILAAYNEYESKREAGDKNARLYINATNTFSEVINSQNVQTLEHINPLEELSMMTRCTPIGVGGIPGAEAYPAKALNTHDTYFGNIDPLETPDGENVGIQQQLTLGANVTNVRGTFMMRDRSNIKPTEILSTGPAMIPFVESNEGARVTMATGQAKQAVPLKNPDAPCVQSGYESLLTPYLSESFIKKSPVNGIVTSIEGDVVSIQDAETKKIKHVDISPITLKSGQGKNGLSQFTPIVSVGDKVKTDQILAEGANIHDGIISNGLNLLVAFMPWKGYNFEDGMVVSESTAKKLVSLHIEEQDVYLTDEDDLVQIANIGEYVQKGGFLITYSNMTEDVESHKHLRSDGGTVVDIEVYCNLPEENIPELLRPSYQAFKTKYTKLKGSYPIGSFKEKNEKIEGILIKFRMQQALAAVKGDKLNNRHFNKGVIAIIEKDENMPVTPWGERVEMIYQPLGILNRMITGQVLEMHCGLMSKKLAELLLKEKRPVFENILTKVMDMLDGTEGKVYSKSLIKNIKSLSDTAYNNLSEKVKKERFFPLIFVPFKSPAREDIEKALTLLDLKARYPLYLPEFDMKTDPVGVGYMYVLKLEHMSEKKISARGVGVYKQQTMAPTAGKRHGGGQALGEYDAYSLMAWDCPILIDEFFGPMSSDHTTKNQIISEIIQTGAGRFKEAKSNPVKDIYTQTMLSIHLSLD